MQRRGRDIEIISGALTARRQHCTDCDAAIPQTLREHEPSQQYDGVGRSKGFVSENCARASTTTHHRRDLTKFAGSLLSERTALRGDTTHVPPRRLS